MFSPCERVCVCHPNKLWSHILESDIPQMLFWALWQVFMHLSVFVDRFFIEIASQLQYSDITNITREWARSKWTLCFNDEHGVSNQARREWHGPTTSIRGCVDIYFSRNYHRSPLEHFRIMRPATLWQLQIPSKSSRCGSGLQIPQIPVWLSILWTCQNKPDLMRTRRGCPRSGSADMDTGPLWAPCGVWHILQVL